MKRISIVPKCMQQGNVSTQQDWREHKTGAEKVGRDKSEG